MRHPDSPDRHLARATIIAAVISVAGSIAGAYLVGQRSAQDDMRPLEARVEEVQQEGQRKDEQLAQALREIAQLRDTLRPRAGTPPGPRMPETTPPTSTTEPPPVKSQQEVVFATAYYRLVITSVSSAGGSVRVAFFVEATLEEKIEIAFGGCGIGGPDEIYLLNEKGERLELDYRNEGSRLFTKRFERTELFPNTRLQGNFLFLAKREPVGAQFTLVLRECEPQPGAQRVINGLTAI